MLKRKSRPNAETKCSITSKHSTSSASWLALRVGVGVSSASSPPHVSERGTRTVEHLALVAQAIALGHQVVNLLSTLQHALDGLVEDNLGLVELLLDLEDAVGLRGVLVLGDVFLELGHDDDRLARRPRGARVGSKEFIDNLAEKLVSNEGRVLVVRHDDAADALGTAVGVEGVVWEVSVSVSEVGLNREDGEDVAVPCSSTSCRWPGRVRSATVFAKRVMNSP